MFTNLSVVTQRLMPLYTAAVLQNIALWYAIEKLFMISIGFNTATIGLMVAIMSTAVLIIETPSGILADRWSRRGVMLVGCACLVLSGLIGGLSHGVVIYIMSTILWGAFDAFYSGTYDSVIYDTVLETDGNSDKYEYHLGRLRACEGVAFVIGALGGGLIASHLSMRSTYFISLPFMALAAVFLWRLREPTLHKAEVAEPVIKHVKQTFQIIIARRSLLPILLSVVGVSLLMDSLYELSQLWFIAVATPLALYGVMSALLFSTWTLGGLVAPYLRRTLANSLALLLMLAALVALIVVRNSWLVMSAQVVLGVVLVALSVLLSKQLHDQLPSRLRAGASSVASTLTRLILVPGSLIFTGVAQNSSIFDASYLLLGLAAVTLAVYPFSRRHLPPLSLTAK